MTREEAINEVKKAMPTMWKETKEALNVLISELAESEDEKIRKSLVEYFSCFKPTDMWNDTFSFSQIISYIEKQKEQTEELSTRLNGLMQEYVKSGKDEEEQEHRLKCYQLFWDALGDSEFFEQKGQDKCPEYCVRSHCIGCPIYEKQKDQKTEWSEKDETRLKVIKEELERFIMFKQYGTPLSVDDIGWLETLPERFNLQPKQEWSEDWREENIQTRFAFYTYKDDPSVLYLSNVFVEETSRNHGFGTSILRAAEKVAETIGATTISLKVKQNSHANAWYRKNGYGYVTFEDGYDWLEKNLEYIKPDKSVEWSEKEMADCMKLTISAIEYDYDAENPMRYKLIHWLKSLRPQPKQEWSNEDEDFINMLILHFNYLINKGGDSVETYKSYIEGLKSLRPQPKQEWSEKDKEMLMKVEQIVLKHWNGLSDSFYHKYDDENQDAESCYNWLKTLSERFNLQPKQEWSDGDEKKLSAVISLMKSSRAVDPFYDKMCLEGWLKSLRPQSIYQAAKHDLAIKFMNYMDENRPKDKMCLSNSECEDIDKAFKENDWAKIVRYIEKYKPQWKPSKEQIGALNYAYCELFKRKDVEHNILGLLQKLIDDFRELL